MLRSAVFCLGLVMVPTGCSSNTTSSTSASSPGNDSSSNQPKPAPTDPAPVGEGKPLAGAPGTACSTAQDCASGICEGLGCEAGQGKCAAADRACTKDLRAFCGCDGQTFRGSSTCPGNRYSAEGPCAGDSGATPPGSPNGQAKAPDGAACLAATDCASGVCEGQGCGNDQPGQCVAQSRPCTRDLAPFCGCDGKTFRNSSRCPGQRYASKGECPAGAAPARPLKDRTP